MSRDDVFTRINRGYYNLTAAEKKVADHVLFCQQGSQFLSISQLAEQAGVAEATISRFCRRLGYEGYSAFRLAVANSSAAGSPAINPLAGEVGPEDSVDDLCRKIYAAEVEAMAQTLELIRPEAITAAAAILRGANQVLCMGQGGSMILAREAAHLFSTALPKFYAVEDSHMQCIRAALLGPEDAILYFSYSGATRSLMDLGPVARSRGTRLILITRFPQSPGAALADVVLECGSRESAFQLGSVAARIAQLYLVDVLFSEVCRRDMAGCTARRRQVADALADKHL